VPVADTAIMKRNSTLFRRSLLPAGILLGVAGFCALNHTIANTPQHGQEWYVSPEGRADNRGSLAEPLDLATALDGHRVKPGDTVWIGGGMYIGTFTSRLTGSSSAPIVVSGAPGQRAHIIGNLAQGVGATLNVFGAWTTYRDFEVSNLNPIRSHGAEFRPMGLEVQAPHTRFINLVIHDAGHGFGIWNPAEDSEVYGNIIYNSGSENTPSDKRYGHAIYMTNDKGTKLIRNNIMFNQFGWGIHAYTKAGVQRGITIERNVIFNSGVLTEPTQRYNNLLVVGDAQPYSAENITIAENSTYHSFDQKFTNSASDANVCFGCFAPLENRNIVLRDNYLVGGAPVALLYNWTGVTVTGNTFIGPQGLVGLFVSSRSPRTSMQSYSWDKNRYFAGGAAQDKPLFALNTDVLRSFASWQQQSGLDANSTFSQSRPTGTKVFVWPNEYEVGRATIVVYNWERAPAIDVDVASLLHNGARYEVRNVQDYFGAPVLSGVFDGKPLHLPMGALRTAAPVGRTESPTPTGPEFNVFVLLPVPGRSLALRSGANQESAISSRTEFSAAENMPVVANANQFAGMYVPADGKAQLQVISDGGVLKLVILTEAGQPAYLLESVAAGRFRLKGMPQGFFAEFDVRQGRAEGLNILRASFPSVSLRRQK
jgi:Right handed beta helix region